MLGFNPRTVVIGPVYLTAMVLGGILGCSAAIFLMRLIPSWLPTRPN